jgi:hypothetical protein
MSTPVEETRPFALAPDAVALDFERELAGNAAHPPHLAELSLNGGGPRDLGARHGGYGPLAAWPLLSDHRA